MNSPDLARALRAQLAATTERHAVAAREASTLAAQMKTQSAEILWVDFAGLAASTHAEAVAAGVYRGPAPRDASAELLGAEAGYLLGGLAPRALLCFAEWLQRVFAAGFNHGAKLSESLCLDRSAMRLPSMRDTSWAEVDRLLKLAMAAGWVRRMAQPEPTAIQRQGFANLHYPKQPEFNAPCIYGYEPVRESVAAQTFLAAWCSKWALSGRERFVLGSNPTDGRDRIELKYEGSLEWVDVGRTPEKKRGAP